MIPAIVSNDFSRSSMNVISSALVAYTHYLSFMICFGALIFERISLKTSPNKREAISMVIADVIYGVAGIALLVSGIYRVIKFGQGAEFYTQNPIFWSKIVIFALVGTLSLYPTTTYILWAIPLSKGNLPNVNSNLIARLKLILNIEIIGFTMIPMFATLMSRGVGLTKL